MTTTYDSVSLAREALAADLAAALDGVKVWATPPATIAGSSVVLANNGWKSHGWQQVLYSVDVTCFANHPDTQNTLRSLEQLTAQTWVAATNAGWHVDTANPPAEFTYSGQPYLGMTFTATRQLDLVTVTA